MKRIGCFFIAVLLVGLLAGCSRSSLPKGNAKRVDFVDGWEIGAASFEYVNENTVKIIREKDGQIFYVPTSSIDMIWVAED